MTAHNDLLSGFFNSRPSHASETNAILFAKSIRHFAGRYRDNQIWLFTTSIGEHTPAFQNECDIFDISLVGFDIRSDKPKFPFLAETVAAASAENRAEGSHEILCWMAANTLVVKEPEEFHLPQNKKLGYRPVHHKLIGTGWDEPVDEFWQWIYDYCRVDKSSLFPMKGHIDGGKSVPTLMRVSLYCDQTQEY